MMIIGMKYHQVVKGFLKGNGTGNGGACWSKKKKGEEKNDRFPTAVYTRTIHLSSPATF